MIKSMTGYGRSEETLHGRTIRVELRGVNSRYLDCSVHLPRNYGFAEDHIRSEVKKSVSRGKVDVFVTVEDAKESEVSVSTNRFMAEGYLKALRELADAFDLEDDITASQLSHFPDILTVERIPRDQDILTEDLSVVLERALNEYDRFRVVEGEKLKLDLLSKLENLDGLVSQVEARSPETVRIYRERLYAKLREVLDDSQIDESRILTEAAVFADKVAVDEETVRLRGHMDRFRAMLSEGGIVGRQIDFLIQEMNREANTIGSKCSDLSIAHVVVDMKSEIEKLREQVQNVE